MFLLPQLTFCVVSESKSLNKNKDTKPEPIKHTMGQTVFLCVCMTIITTTDIFNKT